MTAEAAVDKAAVHKAGSDKLVSEPASDKTVFDKPVSDKSALDRPAVDKAVAVAPVLAHDKRKALGRGLESLLPGPRVVGGTAAAGSALASAVSTSVPSPGPTDGPAGVGGVIAELHGQAARRVAADHEVIDLAIELIDVNPHQTRSFTKREVESLEELRDSIRAQGVIQPITVRPGKEGRYFLITGERRMRASTMARKATIPAIVRVVSEQQAAELTVIENLQRRDLNCMDLARAYIALSQDFGLTQTRSGSGWGCRANRFPTTCGWPSCPRTSRSTCGMGNWNSATRACCST